MQNQTIQKENDKADRIKDLKTKDWQHKLTGN